MTDCFVNREFVCKQDSWKLTVIESGVTENFTVKDRIRAPGS